MHVGGFSRVSLLRAAVRVVLWVRQQQVARRLRVASRDKSPTFSSRAMVVLLLVYTAALACHSILLPRPSGGC